jgi:hypothetical protein
MAGHRLSRLREAITVLQQILDECTPETIDRPGISAADVHGLPFVMKGEPPMAVRKNAESDKEHCANCDDDDCDHPAHERLKKAEEAAGMAGNVAQTQIEDLTKRAEAAEARVKELDALVAKSEADLATLRDEIAIAKMSPEEQEETLLASMPPLVRKSYTDQKARLEMIEKANRDLHEKNERLDYIQKTAEFRAFGMVPDDHWPLLKAVDGMPEAERIEMLRLLKAATEQLKTSDLFGVRGTPGHAQGTQDASGTAEGQIMALAKARAEEKGETLGQAIEAVAKAHPDLWERNQMEKRHTNRVQLGSR